MHQFTNRHCPPVHYGGKIIHTAGDEYGDILVVDDGNQRILSFDSSFEQSCMQRSRPCQLVHQYTQFMALATALVEPVHVTLLGLGGGSLLRTLHHVEPQCHFHIVELRPLVVDIAREYFQLPDDQRTRFTLGDAFEEIAAIESNSSEIIFSDMYDACQMAPGQVQQTFLEQCRRVLREDGWLVINFLGRQGERRAFLQTLGAVFPTVLVGASSENSVLFASATRYDAVAPDSSRLDSLERALRQRFTHLAARLDPFAVPGGRERGTAR
ncbi:spermidine synthase [Parahaliea mediterranea]|uniref:Fused MFS/spermidine synthase n=1 Tax=Parahaliea mediterranea TaxID=651086 RepID=A0A939DE26_9GAMM|nr:fused MFS/spermidine synthase [Parahaliea mediterranea]MBN7796405.1 fused MFS/spermidine synthase [Parahaliea mediterranea]